VAAILGRDDVRNALEALAFTPQASTPEALAAFLAEQLATWRRVVDEVGIARD